jgi:hypothetical protein
MLVKFKTILGENTSRQPVESFRYVDADPCCETMRKNWGEQIATADGNATVVRFKWTDANNYSEYPDAEYELDDDLRFCPFCGEAIRFEESARVKIVARTIRKPARTVVVAEETAVVYDEVPVE